jgi:hypothetical protein
MLKTSLMVLATLVLPLVWGWATHLALKRLWPVQPSGPAHIDGGHEPSLRAPDYQI